MKPAGGRLVIEGNDLQGDGEVANVKDYAGNLDRDAVLRKRLTTDVNLCIDEEIRYCFGGSSDVIRIQPEFDYRIVCNFSRFDSRNKGF